MPFFVCIKAIQDISDQLDNNFELIIEGDKPKTTKSVSLNDLLLTEQALGIAEPSEKINANGILEF